MTDGTHYDAVNDRLKEIVEAVSDETLPLDDALDLFEEAVKLGMEASTMMEEDMAARDAQAEAEELQADAAFAAETEDLQPAPAVAVEADEPQNIPTVPAQADNAEIEPVVTIEADELEVGEASPVPPVEG